MAFEMELQGLLLWEDWKQRTLVHPPGTPRATGSRVGALAGGRKACGRRIGLMLFLCSLHLPPALRLLSVAAGVALADSRPQSLGRRQFSPKRRGADPPPEQRAPHPAWEAVDVALRAEPTLVNASYGFSFSFNLPRAFLSTYKPSVAGNSDSWMEPKPFFCVVSAGRALR